MKDWLRFVREAKAWNFRAVRSLDIRVLSRGAGSRKCRHESGTRIEEKKL